MKGYGNTGVSVAKQVEVRLNGQPKDASFEGRGNH